MSGKSYSIRVRLIALIGLPLVVVAVLIGTFSLLSTFEEIDEVYDAQLAHSAKVLLQLTEHEVDGSELHQIQLGAERPELAHRYENKLTFRIWKNNKLVTQSHQAEIFGDFRAPPGFSNEKIAEEKWRFFVFLDEKSGFNVEVGERSEVRTELIFKILAGLFIPLTVFIPLLLIIIWFGITKGLMPVKRISSIVDRRDSNDLNPIQVAGIPLEINPLINAINRLLARIQGSFERERQFTDNAAHELRTPLAAMKTQTQVLLKKAADMPDCQDGLNNLHASIDRASHMVDQLLSFARLQSENIEFEKIDLSQTIEEVLKDISPLAVRKNVELEARLEPQLYINGNRNALAIMVRNLVDNAIKFTGSNGNVEISTQRSGTDVILCVSDTGQGIPVADKDKVFERFYRVKKSSSGSGLGLSMVKWVCDLHHADIKLQDNQPKGLIVTVRMKSLA